MKIFILLAMFFCHIVDDYYLQGVLAKMKQKKWWAEQTDDEMYKHDYLAALIAHSFSWSFMIMLPWFIYTLCKNENRIIVLIPMFIGNIICHAIVDNAKANKYCINLITDQLLHVFQIVSTYVTLLILLGV